MTDQNPSPTTRMPVPDPPVTPETQRAAVVDPGSIAEVIDTERAVSPSPSPSPPAAEPPPVAPAQPVATPARRDERDTGRIASILFGLVILGVGLWFFAEVTLGYELPRVQWSQLWPVFLIVIGLWVVLGSMRRRSR
jgi:Domain of unknown function (DUF5668)